MVRGWIWWWLPESGRRANDVTQPPLPNDLFVSLRKYGRTFATETRDARDDMCVRVCVGFERVRAGEDHKPSYLGTRVSCACV